jgi:hypothetical protein
MAITEKTRAADEKLREELRHVDPEKLKRVINVLTSASQKQHKPKQSPK